MRKCDVCDNAAVWAYMPGVALYCDNCVPRGCECNHLNEPDLPQGEEGVDWKWISEGVWTHLDEKKREYPCVEYMYDEEGF